MLMGFDRWYTPEPRKINAISNTISHGDSIANFNGFEFEQNELNFIVNDGTLYRVSVTVKRMKQSTMNIKVKTN